MYERDPSHNARFFVIDLDASYSFVELLRTLAHEVIHVIQSYDGRLTITNHNWIWKGKSYGRQPYTNTEQDMKLPWEVEASRRDARLARNFITMVYSIPQT